MAEYVKAASLSDLPEGSAKAVELNGKTVALYNVGGEVFATDNTCLHQGGPLGEGFLEGDIITCPWHMWEYNVRSGENLGEASLKVATYPVKIEGGEILIEV